MAGDVMEKWLPIEGYEGIYEVSDAGRIRNINTSRVLKLWKCHGYMYVSLNIDRKKRGFRVHRLVAKAFIPNDENKPAVNHINGDKTDNRVCNLEWCTNSENEIHSFRSLGKRQKTSLFTDEQVREIRRSGKRASSIAREYGVSLSVAQHVLNGISYKHIN